MRSFVSRGVVVFAGLFAVPTIPGDASSMIPPDPRVIILQRFFEEKDAPAQFWAEDFVAAADANNLDWRLLPSLAFIESGGGKDYYNNNIFGWANGKQKFPSVRHGIHSVAARMGSMKCYKNKNLRLALLTYNPFPHYPAAVIRVMRTIGPPELPLPDSLQPTKAAPQGAARFN